MAKEAGELQDQREGGHKLVRTRSEIEVVRDREQTTESRGGKK